MEKYYVIAKQGYPANIMWDGAGPHVQFLKSCWNSYDTEAEAKEHLALLQSKYGIAKQLSVQIRYIEE